MPLFFDLNLPYSASAGAGAGAGANRDARLRTVVSLLELGYSGAAYNLSLRGVISDKDRCAIAPFPLSSLLAAAPTLAASASFHCRLIGSGAGGGPAFRQFSRATVSVDTAAAAGSVGSTSAVLRGYDVVAVRPVSQSAFEHVCKFSQVDLISIDFSQKVPFRLRNQSVELAIKRGLYFEITYSQLLSDNSNIKRQMLSDAKMLADWTKGRNLIISSGASNANEIRGPNDVSNLISFLLGISKERAKAAISDNCRSLLAKALRKKHFYKETIRIERMPTNQLELNTFSVGDWINWDPLSSGNGDLPSLEQISKVSSSVIPDSSNPKEIKTIDNDPIVYEKPFLLSRHADKLHEITPVSGNREEAGADEMELDYKEALPKECDLKDDNITLVSGNIEETRADEIQLDYQEALPKECDLKDDDVTLVSGGPEQSDRIVHNKIEAPLKKCGYIKDNSAPMSDGYGEELCTETDDLQCDTEVPLSGNSSLLADEFVEELNTPSIRTEFVKDHNAPEAVGISDETISASNSIEATMVENSILNNVMDELYTGTEKINQLKDEKEREGEIINNGDEIVETKEVEGDILKINLIDDEDNKREKSKEGNDAVEEQEGEFKRIKLGDDEETVDATTSTSSSISWMEQVLQDLGRIQDREIFNFTQGPSRTSGTKVKRKQKGLALRLPHTMFFKGPLKHMLFMKKSKR